jgi:hypothetical protein
VNRGQRWSQPRVQLLDSEQGAGHVQLVRLRSSLCAQREDPGQRRIRPRKQCFREFDPRLDRSRAGAEAVRRIHRALELLDRGLDVAEHQLEPTQQIAHEAVPDEAERTPAHGRRRHLADRRHHLLGERAIFEAVSELGDHRNGGRETKRRLWDRAQPFERGASPRHVPAARGRRSRDQRLHEVVARKRDALGRATVGADL